MSIRDFTIAASGTTSDYIHTPGERLVGLIVPTIDSSTITFEFDQDGSGNGSVADLSAHATANAAYNLGNASTGGVYKLVPESIGIQFSVLFGRLVVASQTGGARTVKGVFASLAR